MGANISPYFGPINIIGKGYSSVHKVNHLEG